MGGLLQMLQPPPGATPQISPAALAAMLGATPQMYPGGGGPAFGNLPAGMPAPGAPPQGAQTSPYQAALQQLWNRFAQPGAAPPTGQVPGRMAPQQPPGLQPQQGQNPPLNSMQSLNPSSMRVDFHPPPGPE